MLYNYFVSTCLLFAFLCGASSVKAAEHFVATNGSDDNEGTRASPFATIDTALQHSQSGDTIYVLEGTYSNFTQIRDYHFQAPVTITPYANHRVIIDGTKRKQDNRRAAFDIRDSENIIIDGFEIRHITTDDADFFPAGILVRGKSQRITLRNNHIHHIENNADDGNAHGILIYGDDPTPMKNIVIEQNILHHLTLGSSESLTVSGNVNGLHMTSNLLLGATDRTFLATTLEDSSLNVAINEQAILYMESTEKKPLLWRASFGSGRIMTLNANILSEKVSRGILTGMLSHMDDVFMYPIFNAKTFYIDDFPAPIAQGRNDIIYNEFRKDLADFYRNIWWSDMLRVANTTNIYYTGANSSKATAKSAFTAITIHR